MKLIETLFFKEGVFSWRKALTALVAFIFAFVAIGYEFGLKEIPDSYQMIIAGVFAFYFTKEIFENVKITKKD